MRLAQALHRMNDACTEKVYFAGIRRLGKGGRHHRADVRQSSVNLLVD